MTRFIEASERIQRMAAGVSPRVGADIYPLDEMRTARRSREVVEEAREILGGNGILLEHTVARRFADMEAVYTYEGADTAQSLIVGREITGLQAFSR